MLLLFCFTHTKESNGKTKFDSDLFWRDDLRIKLCNNSSSLVGAGEKLLVPISVSGLNASSLLSV